MLQNYIKIAFRNLLKSKGYSAINIFGLAIGIASCLLIVQHLRHELSYDAHHDELGQLYRIGSTFKIGDKETKTATSPSPLAWAMVQDYPEVKEAARVLVAPNTTEYLIKYENQSYFEQNGLLADSTFFRLFKFDFVEGDPVNSLNEPYHVVVSIQMAEKLFGEAKALDRTIKIGDQWGENDYKITGVFNPETYPTYLNGNFYMNMRSGEVGQYFYALPEWAGNNLFYTYVLLNENASAESLAAKFPALIEEKAGQRLKDLGFEKTHFIEPVKDIYLRSDAQYEVGLTGDITFVYIFAAIAAFILLIACINFMNLSTAKATIRAQEVGVRKVVGATRSMLSAQFLTEAFVYTFLAVILAYIGAEMVLPIFNQLSGKELDLNLMNDGVLVTWLVAILILTALLAGSYPALYLSSFSPVKVFKGNLGDRFSAKQVRKFLVVVQFVVSIALIQGILVINQQMDYMRQKKLGFEPEAKLVIPLNTSDAALNFQTLKEQFLQITDVEALGGTSTVPGTPNIEDMLIFGEGQNNDESVHANQIWTDPGYLPMMDFNLLKGRVFDESRFADTTDAVVINQKLMTKLGYDFDNVIGKKLYWNWDGTLNSHEIIGVIDNFHSSSLRQEIDNHVFHWNPNRYLRYMVASVSTNDLPNLIDDLNNNWDQINAGEPFDYFFMDDKLQQAYDTDQRMAGLIFSFTLLAILISCLGLFGLAAFSAESRTKEIGVRKVLGATNGGIVGLLTKEFIWLVVIALAVATPFAWSLMNSWLEGFHYRVDMPYWVFVAAGIVAISITFITVGYQGLKAALANPIESLRSE